MTESTTPGLLPEQLDKMTKALVDNGQLIEAGFLGLRASLPPDLREASLDIIRTAYFGGAQHLFASITAMLDPEREPTARDMRRMTSIHDELERWRVDIKSRSARESGV